MILDTEKYRPSKYNELVFINEDFANKVKSWIDNKMLDSHLLFYGNPGTGKSSTIRVLLNELNITDTMTINGSDNTGVDYTRKVIEYASVPPYSSPFKVIVYEEFEKLSKSAQDALKVVLEKYAGWCRFIFTTNDITKVSEAILSRTERYNFNELDKKQYVEKLIYILNDKKVKFDLNDVVRYVQETYPDLRQCINLLSKQTINNELKPFNDFDDVKCQEFKEIFESFMNGNITLLQLQKSISSMTSFEDYYRFLYNNIDKYVKNVDKCILKIADYLYKNETVAYKDINLVACIIEMKGE